MAQCEGTLLQAVHDMEEWTCPLCTRRRGGLRSAALRSAPAKLEPAVAADGRASRDEITASPPEVPRAARERQMGADGALAPTGLKLRLPAAKEVRNNFSLHGRSTARSNVVRGEYTLQLGFSLACLLLEGLDKSASLSDK
jgi:hypothetical protein